MKTIIRSIGSFFIPLLFSLSLQAVEQKIIFLISPPRSLSVAFLRMMDQRGDFAILHEPGIPAFNVIYNPMFASTAYRSNALFTFREVHDQIAQTAENSPVFVKEMGFAACEYLPQMSDLLSNPEAYFVFLVRNPHHSLISHYNKYPVLHAFLHKVLSYKELYYLYREIQSRSVNPPMILLTEDLYTDPRKTVQCFCDAVKIPFKEESLYWDDLGDQFSAQNEWKDVKHKDKVQHWHREAIRSTGFGLPTTTYAVDHENRPTFEEIKNLEHRTAYQRIYDENMPYYRLLVEANRLNN